MIYYLVARDVGAVKIGYTYSCPRKRLQGAQTNCPIELTLAAHHDGELSDEAYLHAKFADDRLRGEWFKLSERLQRHLAALPTPIDPVDGRTTRWARERAAALAKAA